MTRTIRNLKMGFSKESEILKKTQDEMKVWLKSSTTQLKKPRASLTSRRMDQAEDKNIRTQR